MIKENDLNFGQSVMFFLSKAKPDLTNITLPVRQTASIFKQPVTKVTNHPNNKVKTDPQKAVDQPKQVRTEDMCLCFVPSYLVIEQGKNMVLIL